MRKFWAYALLALAVVGAAAFFMLGGFPRFLRMRFLGSEAQKTAAKKAETDFETAVKGIADESKS